MPTAKIMNPAPWCKEPSLIFANLTEEEAENYHLNHVPYSGSTGNRKPTVQEPYQPYIAGMGRDLERALNALGWTHIDIKINNNQWIITKRHPKTIVILEIINLLQRLS